METFTTLLIYLVSFFINDSCPCETNKPDFKSEYNSSQTIIIGEVLDIKYVKYNIETKKLTYHEDIYDLGEMLYEHVPLMGTIIKWLKRRLAQ